jgi:hypothetical protein
VYIEGFNPQGHQPTRLASRCAFDNVCDNRETGFVGGANAPGAGPANCGPAVNEPDAVTLEIGFQLSEYDPVLAALLGGEMP